MGKKARQWKKRAKIAEASNRALAANQIAMENEMVRMSHEHAAAYAAGGASPTTTSPAAEGATADATEA
jgi:hypothetical protein